MQLGGVRSTSQAANSFIGTGFCPLLVVILLPLPPPAEPAVVADAAPPAAALAAAADAEPLPLPPPLLLLATNLSINLADLSTIFMLNLLLWFDVVVVVNIVCFVLFICC